MRMNGQTLKKGLERLAMACVTLCVAATCALPRAQPLAIDPVQAAALGNKARDEFLSTRPTSSDGKLWVRVEKIGQRVARISDRPGVFYQFIVIQDEEAQAWSFPGGTVCVTDTLVQMMTTDDELAFALGHEMAHITQGHHIQMYIQLVKNSGNKRSERAMLDAVLSEYGVDWEVEADRFAALYAYRAEYEFSAATDALQKLASRLDAVQQDTVHRHYDERIAMLKDYRKVLNLTFETFHAATTSLEAGQIDEAINLLLLFLAEFPQSVSGNYNLGAAYLARVRRHAPLEVAEVLPILPEPDPSRIREGMYDLIDLDKARLHFKTALRFEPQEAYALAGLGLVQIRLGESGRARENLERARKLAPNSPEILLGLGNLHFLADELEAAEANYRAAFLLRPRWNAARMNLALTCERLDKSAEARALWQELVAEPAFHDLAVSHLRDLPEQPSEHHP